MLNKAILMGRLTRDPELRHTQNNTSVVSFTLAVDRGFRSRNQNSDQPTADFIDIVAWQSTAEFVSKWFRKGMQVAVCGRIQTRQWKDRDGNNRTAFEVVAEEVTFADTKRAGDYQTGGNFPAASQESADAPSEARDDGNGFTEIAGGAEDELPF